MQNVDWRILVIIGAGLLWLVLVRWVLPKAGVRT